jgi:hypothetical protein
MVAERGPFSQAAGRLALRPELSRIAPTVAVDFYSDYGQMLRAVADVVGRPER